MVNTIFDSMKFEPYQFREYPKALSIPGAPQEVGKAPPQVIVNDADEEERVVNQWGYTSESFAMTTAAAVGVAMPSGMTPEEKLAAFLAANPDVAAVSAPKGLETDPLKMPFFSLKAFTKEKTGKDPAGKEEALALLREARVIA